MLLDDRRLKIPDLAYWWIFTLENKNWHSEDVSIEYLAMTHNNKVQFVEIKCEDRNFVHMHVTPFANTNRSRWNFAEISLLEIVKIDLDFDIVPIYIYRLS